MEQIKRSRDLDYYPSDIVGQTIVDARTGAKQPWCVGESGERRFFKVRDTSSSVTLFSKEYGLCITHTLFYETPYQYMKHRNVVLDDEFIKAWYDSKNELFPGEFCNVKI